jgi:drug/metabolite transporter (DMT)-like permease
VSGAAVALALASAALHALWNTLLADADDTHAGTAASLLAAAVLFAPVAVLAWDVDGDAVPYVAGSAALELAYFGLLATAYSRAALTFVYPVARGSAPVLVLAVSVAALGVSLGFWQVAGVLAVAAGVVLVRGAALAAGAAALPLALGVGACIAGYTLVDDHGLEHAAALPYFECVLAITAVAYAAAVAARPGGGAALRRAMGARAAVTGIGMFAAYALALAALERAEAAPVAALRETSVVMAALAAVLMGRERVPARRLAGAAAVVAGAAAIALG